MKLSKLHENLLYDALDRLTYITHYFQSEIYSTTTIFLEVLSTVLITVMLSVGFFYLTQLRSFFGCCFDYLPPFIPYRYVVFT